MDSPRTVFNVRNSECPTVVETCVFFMNKLGVNLEIEDTNSITAESLIQLILSEEEIGLPLEAANVFSLWFTSSYLEVQLKPHHNPYKIRLQWPELLKKYTTVDEDKILTDEPILCFQRNVFCPKRQEMKVKNKVVVEMLYGEAKTNVLEGRYPCEEASYYMLAGLQARIELGCYNPDIHTLDYFRSNIRKFLPRHMCGSRWLSLIRRGFNSKNGPESRILEQFRHLASENRLDTLQKKYLEFCWTLPYYGSAFFRGQIENPCRGLQSLFSMGDKPVQVAINADGIFLICQYENVILLGLKYEEFCWGFTRPRNPSNPDFFPCVYVQFHSTEHSKKVLKILQIFSKQAVMMDALISYYVNELKKRKSASLSLSSHGSLIYGRLEPDDYELENSSPSSPIFSDAVVPLTKATITRRQSAESCISNKLNRLSLATFNEEGSCIGQSGSWTLAH